MPTKESFRFRKEQNKIPRRIFAVNTTHSLAGGGGGDGGGAELAANFSFNYQAVTSVTGLSAFL